MNMPKPQIDRETAMKLWIEEHSDYAKEQVVLSNTGLIPYVLKSLNQNVLDEDLFAIGIVGLCKAINGFDANRGVEFNTYAVRSIRNEILQSFRKKRVIPAFSLDEPYIFDNGEEVSYADMIAGSKNFEEDVIACMQFEEIINLLTDRERKIISLHMDGKAQNEIAKIFGISQAQVSRIIKSIYRKWRKQNEL